MDDIQRGNDGKWYRKIGPNEFEETEAPRQPSPGRAGKEQIFRGIAGGVGSLIDAGQYIGNEMFAKTQAMRRRLGFEGAPPAPIEGPSYQERLANATGIGPPTTFAGKVGERFGQGVAAYPVTGPMLYGMGGAKALTLGIIGDVVSSISSQVAADQGAGPVGQTLAGFASLVVPSGMAGAADDVSRAVRSSRFAREAADAAPLSLTPAQTKQVASLAKEFGTSSDEIIDSIGVWNDIFPRGPKSNPRMHIEEAISKLKESIKIWPDPEVRPLVSQILYDEGGANLAHLNAGLMSQTDANAKAAGLRIRVARDLSERIESMAPKSSGPAVNAATKAAYDKLKAAEQSAWNAIPRNEMPHISTGALDEAAKRASEIEAYRDLVGPEIAVINRLKERFGKRAPFDQVQALRSRLLEITRSADNPLADGDAKNRARAAGLLLEPIEQYIKNLPDNGSAAYRAARDATSRLHDFFPRKSKGIRAAMNYEDAKSIVRDIKSVPNSAVEVRRVMRTLEQEPGAIDSLKRAFWDDLFDGQNPVDVPPRAVRSKIRGKSRMYSALFGEMADPRTGKRGIDVIDQLLTEATIAKRDVIGTAAEARVTRSGLRPVQKLLAGVSAVTHPAQTMDKGLQVVSEEIDKVATSAFWRKAIFTELLFDPPRAIQFMEIPTPRQVPGWKENFTILVARARARTKMAAALETDALARTTAQEGENSMTADPAAVNMGGVR